MESYRTGFFLIITVLNWADADKDECFLADSERLPHNSSSGAPSLMYAQNFRAG